MNKKIELSYIYSASTACKRCTWFHFGVLVSTFCDQIYKTINQIDCDKHLCVESTFSTILSKKNIVEFDLFITSDFCLYYYIIFYFI